MKIQNLLQESITSILDLIYDNCEKDKANCARYMAAIMVLKDMNGRLTAEDDPLQKHTYIDYMYGNTDQTKKALGKFYDRIQENPRARNLFKKYEKQFLDFEYGHTIMRNKIEMLKPHFNQRKIDRVKHHQDRLINNLAKAQDKIAAEYVEGDDLQNGDTTLDHQTFGRQDRS